MTDQETNFYSMGTPEPEIGIHGPLAQPMVATPTDFALGTQLNQLNQEQQAGRSTDMSEQTQRAIEQATRLADIMAAKGASDQEIMQAVGSIPGVNADNRAAVQAAAQNTADAHKFSILGGSGKAAEPAALTLGSILGIDEKKPEAEASESNGLFGAVTAERALGASAKAPAKYILSDAERANQPNTFGEAVEGMGGSFTPTGPNAIQRIVSQGRGA